MKKQGPQKFVQVDYDTYFSLSSFLVSRIYFICGFFGFYLSGFFLVVVWLFCFVGSLAGCSGFLNYCVVFFSFYFTKLFY